MELGKKDGGFAFCILVPEARSAPNTKYQLEREWMFQRNVLLKQNITLFMRIVTPIPNFLFCQEEHSEGNKWQRVFFNLLYIELILFGFLFPFKNPNKFYDFSILFNNLSEIS